MIFPWEIAACRIPSAIKKLKARTNKIQGQVIALKKCSMNRMNVPCLQQIAAIRGAVNGLMRARSLRPSGRTYRS
jgi:DNA-binding FrmR family transcriptional regulator